MRLGRGTIAPRRIGAARCKMRALPASTVHAFKVRRTPGRATILALLNDHRDVLLARFGARHLALLGSAARDEMRPESDVDGLVDFEGAATYDGYFDLKDSLEVLLRRPVDLVTEKAKLEKCEASR